MKTILKSSLFIIGVIGVAGLIGFTTAYFSDTESSRNNMFQAGSLDLEIKKSANAIWTAGNLLPGDEVSGEIELENSGSLPIESLIFEVESI